MASALERFTGDTLSILWATVKGLPLQEHRKHGLATGQLQQLHAL